MVMSDWLRDWMCENKLKALLCSFGLGAGYILAIIGLVTLVRDLTYVLGH